MLRVGDHPELQAVVRAWRRIPAEVRKAINADTRSTMNPVWRDAVSSRASTRQDTAVLGKGARIAAGNPPSFVAASSTRPLSGGLVPRDNWAPIEFGASARDATTTYARRTPSGGTARVTRRTKRGLPTRAPRGRVVFPAVAELGPRLASLWVQTIVRIVHKAADGEL